MRRNVKVKLASKRMPLRKTVTSGSAAMRRSFPAWVDAGGEAVVFTAARGATPRVRVGLVLRAVNQRKASGRAGCNASSRR